jgi:DNA polymerase-3 subunit epsilon
VEGNIFVSHNTDFDFGLLQKKFRDRGEELKAKGLCTLRLAEELIPGLHNYNLDALASFFSVKIRDRHRATGDALATLEIFRELQKLRMNTRSLPLYLPHHEKFLRDLPKKAGLFRLVDSHGTTVKLEATSDIEKRARELLEVKRENRELLLVTTDIEYKLTGSALIAEFEKLALRPVQFHWAVVLEGQERGELRFAAKPYRKETTGLWFFVHQAEARKKARELNEKLRDRKLIYQEGGKSKEEIVRSNQKAFELSRMEKFPSAHILITGEGRTINERALILVIDNHVKGYGFTEARDEEILRNPELYLTRTYNRNLGVDIATRRYLRVMKNLRQKTESWRSLSVKTVIENYDESKTL